MWLVPLTLASSLVPAVLLLLLSEGRRAARLTVGLVALGALTTLTLVGALLVGVARGARHEWRVEFVADLDLLLRAEPLSLLLACLAAVLFLVTALYTLGYLEASPRRTHFLGYLGLCAGATIGVALAGNPITFLVFSELLTVAAYPLVVHHGSDAALAAGKRFLLYSLAGGGVLLVGIVWLHLLAGPVEFAAGGVLAGESSRAQLTAVFALLIVGLGVKIAFVPLHLWLPGAHAIAPGPASAFLSGLAVKAGAFGVARVVYDLYGVQLARHLGLLEPLAGVAAVTIMYGSVRALTEDALKRRLAYSTVSQLSYVALAVAVAGPLAATGGLAHLVHLGAMKATMFYCAGNLARTLGLHRVGELRGVGRRMPWTMAAFTVAAFGMIGVPPMAGFVSKWALALGALEAGAGGLVIPVLVGSSLLNAAYFLPIVYRAWFAEPDTRWADRDAGGRSEASLPLLIPPVATAALVLLAGVLAGAALSPLSWAAFVAQGVFG